MRLITQSGSAYQLRRDAAGVWWLRADTVPSRHSVRLTPTVEWEVDVLIPPTVGKRAHLYAPAHLDRDDPRRMPGGGKVTSPILYIDL